MKLKVVKNVYYVSDKLSEGLIDETEFQNSLAHLLVVGDVWEEDKDGDLICMEGVWKGECNVGWWHYEDVEKYFEKI